MKTSNFLTSPISSIIGLFMGGGISLDAIIKQGLAQGWGLALLGLGIAIVCALINENPTAKTIANEALPLADAFTATSTNPTVQSLHKVIDQLVTGLQNSVPVVAGLPASPASSGHSAPATEAVDTSIKA